MRLCANKILYDLRVAGFSGRDDLEERLPELKKAYLDLRGVADETMAVRDDDLTSALNKIRELGRSRENQLRK
jgi:hypothetical protein